MTTAQPLDAHTVAVPSPCVSVCAMNLETPALCTGCLRTIPEIAGWSRMQDGEKRQVWCRIAQRRTERTATRP